MKRTVFLVFAWIFVFVTLCACFTACSEEKAVVIESEILGVWSMPYEAPDAQMDLIMQFKSDGTGSMYPENIVPTDSFKDAVEEAGGDLEENLAALAEAVSSVFSFTVEGENLYLTMNDDEKGISTFKVEGNVLTINEGGTEMVFSKKP